MKLGAKKSTSAQLIDDMGREAAPSNDEVKEKPGAPAASKGGRGSIPPIAKKSVHLEIQEQVTLALSREGGLNSLELKGDMNLLVANPADSKIRLVVNDLEPGLDAAIQFKQHPNVAKFVPDEPKIISMKDVKRGFPDNRALAVLKWRYTGRDERLVPLSITCWPTPTGDGACDVNIEYEIDHDGLELHDVIISIPLPSGSYPTITSHSGSWTVNPSTHSLDWSIPTISKGDEATQSGTLEFNVGGDDAEAFFPLTAAFVAAGSLAGIGVSSVSRVDNSTEVAFSQDSVLSVGEFTVS